MSRRRADRGPTVERTEGEVRDLLPGGDAVVVTPAGVVFTVGALPGERVVLSHVRRAGRVLRGRLARVLAPSDDRVEPACPHVAACGGCPLMPMRDEVQGQWLERFLRLAIEGLPGAATTEVALRRAGPRLGYRQRARLHFRVERGVTALGYRGRRSAALVDVGACPILVAALGRGLERVRAGWLGALHGEGELLLAVGRGGQPVAQVRTEAPQRPEAYAVGEALVASGDFAGASLAVGSPPSVASWGDALERTEGVDGLELVGSAGGFAQANAEINRGLVERAVELAVPDGVEVLELYAGNGNLTVPLARRAAHVLAVEQSPGAAAACRANLASRGLRGTVRAMDVAELASALPPAVEVVVLDPPRAGAAEAVESILRLAPRRIVYVSCDVQSLARDLRRLCEGGYRVDVAEAFDMFPHTGHVESLVRLTRG